ncbi:MAG: FeoA domain-containing protein [Synergistetes bacterium]|nr:FeoA domain-containing protein [Synergistota bacterium]
MDAPIGRELVVEDIYCGYGRRSALSNMGILPGVRLFIVKRGAFGGPILVNVGGSQVAIGRGLAAKIDVKVLR